MLFRSYKVEVLPSIRTDSTVAKAIRLRGFIADVDPKAKCLEDYRVVADRVMALYGIGQEKGHGNEEQASTIA